MWERALSWWRMTPFLLTEEESILSKADYCRDRGDCLIIFLQFVMDNSLKFSPYTQHDLLLVKSPSQLMSKSVSSTDPLTTALYIIKWCQLFGRCLNRIFFRLFVWILTIFVLMKLSELLKDKNDHCYSFIYITSLSLYMYVCVSVCVCACAS